MATEYEYWGKKFIEPDDEDGFEDISYYVNFETPVAFDVKLNNGEWLEDKSYDGWEYADTFVGDYSETIDPDYIYETIRDVIAEQIVNGYPKLNGHYRITADAEFRVAIDGVYWREDDDTLSIEDGEIEIIDVRINNINIERL